MIKTIIFDCFGVLASEGWRHFRAKHFGHDQQRSTQVNDAMKAVSLGYMSADDFLTTVAELSGEAPAAIRQYLYHNYPDKALFDFIQHHKSQYRFGVLSNISAGRLEHIFSRQQLALFDSVVLSCEIGVAKPDPKAYVIAAERLGTLPKECLFVDDQARNVDAAEVLGMRGIVYKTYTQFEAEARIILG